MVGDDSVSLDGSAKVASVDVKDGVDVLARSDGTLLALFESRYWLDRLLGEQPELVLEPLVAGELGG